MHVTTLLDRSPAWTFHPPHQPIRSVEGFYPSFADDHARPVDRPRAASRCRIIASPPYGQGGPRRICGVRSLKTRGCTRKIWRSVQTEARATSEQNIEQLAGAARKQDAGALRSAVWSFDWNGFVESAWMSARDIGAVGYMEPDVIEEYSTLYRQQTFVNEEGVGILFDQAKAASHRTRRQETTRTPRSCYRAISQAMLLFGGCRLMGASRHCRRP